jgi:branched-chain amino acid transport system ATP-binding protein
MSELLELVNVHAGYGAAVVLEAVDVTMVDGQSIALLGKNGVGKTTLVATLMGHTRVHEGSMRWLGRDLKGMAPYARARAGIGWVPQQREIFPSLSVEENLTVACRPGAWNASRVWELFPRLAERRRNFGDQLSGGEQQMLAIGRALMLNPRLLLLDEPLEGLAPIIVEELVRAIDRMTRREGLSVILVEHHAEIALSLTQEALVLERGRVVYRGPSSELARDQSVLAGLTGVARPQEGCARGTNEKKT